MAKRKQCDAGYMAVPLPGMPRPQFGGLRYLPMDTGLQSPGRLDWAAPADGGAVDMFATADEAEFGDCADLIRE